MIDQEAMAGILLVEDNPSDAELVLRTLKKHKIANEPMWVKDGEQALDYLLRRGAYAGRPDTLPRVMLLDLRLPKVDGIEVLRQVRGHPALKELPVVVLTSSKEERDLVESYKLGANSYIAKPVEFEEFMRVVAEIGLYWAVLNRVPGQ